MASVDVRTRTAADVRPVDATEFFETELPALAADHGDLAAPGARQLGLRPLTVGVAGSAWTLSFENDGFAVVRGDGNAHAAVEVTDEQLADIVNDLLTPVGLFTGGELAMTKGRLDDFLDWWVVLRSLIDERAVHTHGAVDFHDGDGAPLDLGRTFGLDDIDAAAHFLAEAGYVHLAGVFDDDEMNAISADMDAAASSYADGDGRSWWATTNKDERRLVRMQYFHEQSSATKDLLADARLQKVAELTDDDHRLGKPGSNTNIVEALVKPIGVVEGISDVPWHKDCSLGSHSYRCCSLTIGISVTGAGPDSGQLRVVAGSHRALIQPAFVRQGLDLPMVDLPTETGDVTVHCSCTLHMSQPPVRRERRVLYTDFNLPPLAGGRDDPGESKIKRIREGAPTTVSQTPSPVG